MPSVGKRSENSPLLEPFSARILTGEDHAAYFKKNIHFNRRAFRGCRSNCGGAGGCR
jgi:hypothetical protein